MTEVEKARYDLVYACKELTYADIPANRDDVDGAAQVLVEALKAEQRRLADPEGQR